MAYDYDKAKQIVIDALRDEDQRGGPMQREYPRAIIESLAHNIALQIEEEAVSE
jgi:hypothetical protein